MKRRSLHNLAIASVAVVVTAITLWVRSCYHCDHIRWDSTSATHDWYSQWYCLYYRRVSPEPYSAHGWTYGHAPLGNAPGRSPIGSFTWYADAHCFVIGVPWLALGVFGVPACALWVRRHGFPRGSRHPLWIPVNALAMAEAAGAVGAAHVGWVFFAATLIAAFLLTLRDSLRLSWQSLNRRVYPPGLCQTCGYDLRASRIRCPECGTPIPS